MMLVGSVQRCWWSTGSTVAHGTPACSSGWSFAQASVWQGSGCVDPFSHWCPCWPWEGSYRCLHPWETERNSRHKEHFMSISTSTTLQALAAESVFTGPHYPIFSALCDYVTWTTHSSEFMWLFPPKGFYAHVTVTIVTNNDRRQTQQWLHSSEGEEIGDLLNISAQEIDVGRVRGLERSL